MKKHNLLLNGIITIIVGIFLSIVFFNILINSLNMKYIMIPFLITSIIIIINGITNVLKDLSLNSERTDFDKIGNIENLKKIEQKSKYIYYLSFFAFWFIILILGDIEAIKSWHNGGKYLFLFSLIFWLAGIISIIVLIKANKKEADYSSRN